MIEKKKRKIALYGIGTETEKAIKTLKRDNEIIGLLDGFETKGEAFGEQIISLDEAISNGVERVIIIARPGSCKAIARRIAEKCKYNSVELYDIRGIDFINQSRKIYNLNNVWENVEQSKNSEIPSDGVKARLFNQRLKKIMNNENKVVIRDAFDVGYLFCAPIITDFVLWFYAKIKQASIANIWFGSRDGYLIKKLVEIMDSEFKSTYFLTSRVASIRSGVNNDEDIKYVNSMKFSGTLRENMKARFDIEVEECDDPQKGLLGYKDSILNKAEVCRQGYEKYIESLNLETGDVAFFDFVAKGTTQYFIGKFVHKHIKGFYFLQLEPEFMSDKELDIEPFYSNDELHSSAIFDNYYILETILTAPEPSIIGFTVGGKPIYASETRSKDNIECFLNVQRGIITYFQDFLEKCSNSDRIINKKFDEVFLRLIHNIDIQDTSFTSLMVEDPFFNRMTSIMDVL